MAIKHESVDPKRRKRTAKPKPRRSNIFISYRRDDSAPYARHLFESLAARFGEPRVFFDQSTIEPGAAFPKRIRTAIASSGVMLAVIGPRWLDSAAGSSKPRIRQAADWVRREIELGLRSGLRVIPVWVDGASPLAKNELPPSLAPMSTLQAVTMHWHESVGELSKVITEVTDLGSRYDLTRYVRGRPEAWLKRATVLNAMEISLAHQGELVTLDDKDLSAKIKQVTGRELDVGVSRDEIAKVVNLLGIAGRTARGASRIYTARAMKLRSRAQIPTELAKGRPIVAGVRVHKKWWSRAVTKTGLIEDWKEPGLVQGSLLTAIVGFDPTDGSLRFTTYFPNWGEPGLGTITAAAAKRFMDDPTSMFSIEAAELVAF